MVSLQSRLETADCRLGGKCRLLLSTDFSFVLCDHFYYIFIFIVLRANRKQADRDVIQSNLSVEVSVFMERVLDRSP